MTSISGTSSNAATSGTGSSSASSTDKLSLGASFNDFLTLLTTQMQYQDPLDPMDSSEWTNQLVQFSQVEQQINTNDKLGSLTTLTNNGQVSTAISMIGLNVEVNGNTFTHAAGESAPMSYSLPSEAKTANLIIKDSSGTVVRTVTGETSIGKHSYTWDGKNAEGETAPAGDYTIQVAAYDTEGNGISDVSTTVTGKVSGVESGSGGMVLRVGDVPVSIDSIVAAGQTAGTTGGKS